jgi:hypothetical protein
MPLKLDSKDAYCYVAAVAAAAMLPCSDSQ